MSDPQQPRNPKRITAIILGVLVLVIAAVTGIALFASGAGVRAAGLQPPTAAGTAPIATANSPLVTVTPAASTETPTPTPTPTNSPTKSTAAPTPQPTKTATISKPKAVPIKKELTATVVKMEAVTGTAQGPGEIGGPSVRFAIRIVNTTGKPFVLSNTVVNAYYGTGATPAVQLHQPGGKDFPASVQNNASETGVFIFNIPTSARGDVRVTVDTSVRNPVVAFQGTAPRS